MTRTSIDWIGFTHVAFIVNDAKEAFRKLEKARTEFVSKPQDVPAGPNKGAIAYYFFDPDRITLEIIQPPMKT